MQDQLKRYHRVLPVLFIPICLLIPTNYGWIGYATLTGRPGLKGSYYLYYNLEMYQFLIYNFVIAAIGIGLIVAQINCLIKKNPRCLTKAFWAFAIFIVLIIVCEIGLHKTFTGKV